MGKIKSVVNVILINVNQYQYSTMSKQHPANSTLKTKTIVKQQKTAPVKQSPMQHLPLIQDLLAIPKEEREQKCIAFHEKIKPFFPQYAQKKLGSRVLQLIYKWGNKQVKEWMFNSLKKNWKDLIKSKYALYLIEHIARDFSIPEIVDDVILLQGSWEGANVIQAFIENSGDEGFRLVKSKFYELWEKSKNNDLKAQQTLHNLALKVIEKQYDNIIISKLILKLSLGSMFAEEKQKVLEYLVEKVNTWVNDEDGVRLFFEVINHSEPKLKKQIVKAFKTHVKEIVEVNNHSYVALIKLLTEVDDTVLLQKSLQSEIQQLFPLMSSNKKAFSVVFSIFSPRNHNFNVLGKYEHTVVHTECKKSEQLRKQELRKSLYEPLLNYLSENELYHILRHHMNNKLVIAVFKALQEDYQTEAYSAFITKVASLFLQDAKDAFKTKTFSQCLAADPNANKILKQILLLIDDNVDYFCDEFGKLASRNLTDFLESKASFVLLGLIEKGGRDYLLQEVKKNRKILQSEKVVAGQHYLNLLKK